MYNIESESFHISITIALYRHNALPEYYENSRNSDGFIYYIKGGHTINFEDYSITTSPGKLLYLPCSGKYKNKLLSPDTEYYQIDFRLLDGEKAVSLFDKATVFPEELSEKALPSVKNIYNTFYSSAPGARLMCCAEIMKLIALFTSQDDPSRSRGDDIDKIRKTVTFIKENYTLDTSVKELAEISSMSVSNLEKLFKKSFSMSPVSYRNKLRTEHAKRLLAGGYSVAQTAFMTGFSDYFYFLRIFKKYAGCTPSEYTEKAKGI